MQMPGDELPVAQSELIGVECFVSQSPTPTEEGTETQWLIKASSQAIYKVMSGRNLGNELDALVAKFREFGDAETLINEGSGIVALVGLYHVLEGQLTARDVLEAIPSLVTETATQTKHSFSSDLADATEQFCIEFGQQNSSVMPKNTEGGGERHGTPEAGRARSGW